MDHYFDQAAMLMYAKKTGNREMNSVFNQARALLFTNAVLLLVALVLSPPLTWAMVAIFFGPAFVWDFKLFAYGQSPKTNIDGKADKSKKTFTIKRIPGMKAVLIGIIRGFVTHLKTCRSNPLID